MDISVDMVAPEQAGSYQSNWKLSNDQGGLFGIGPAGDAPIWVRIVVLPPLEVATAPAPTQSPTPRTLVSGMVTLLPGDSLDLDTNRISLEADSDLTYTRGTPGEWYLQTASGVLVGELLSDEPGMQDCNQAVLAEGAVYAIPANMGKFFCYQTSLGLPGWGRLVLQDAGTAALTLEIHTWTAP